MSDAGLGGTQVEAPLLFVSLGTDRRPFARLLRWVGHWAADHPRWRIEVQHGVPPAPPSGHPVAHVPRDELRLLLRAAAVVVTDADQATISRARAAGHVPVVVARDPAFGEHVDDGQILLARRLGAAGVAWLAESEAGLERAIGTALAAAAASADGDPVAHRPGASQHGQGSGGGRGGPGIDRGPRAPGRRAVRRRRRR